MEFEADIINNEGKIEKLQRYYHPMSKVNDKGILDLLIKVYIKSFNFP